MQHPPALVRERWGGQRHRLGRLHATDCQATPEDDKGALLHSKSELCITKKVKTEEKLKIESTFLLQNL